MGWYEWLAGTTDTTTPNDQLSRIRNNRSKLNVRLKRNMAPKQDGIESGETYHERVFVRVYDLGQTFLTRWYNGITKHYGAFHTGVEVYGMEWSFGLTPDYWSTGITWNEPGQNPDHTFRETLAMGYTSCSPEQVYQILEGMKVEWRGCTYHVLSRNCHTFSDAFCDKLGVARLPSWVNDLAQTGAAVGEYICVNPELEDRTMRREPFTLDSEAADEDPFYALRRDRM